MKEFRSGGQEQGMRIGLPFAPAMPSQFLETQARRSIRGPTSAREGIHSPGAVGVDAGLDAELGDERRVDVAAEERGGVDRGNGSGSEDGGGELHDDKK